MNNVKNIGTNECREPVPGSRQPALTVQYISAATELAPEGDEEVPDPHYQLAAGSSRPEPVPQRSRAG